MMTPKELAILAAKALDEKKGKEISAIEITDITTLADYFVIATGSSKITNAKIASRLGCRGLTLVFLWKNCYNNLNLEHSAQTVRI